MRTDHQVVVFDAADLSTESSFWAGVLDGTIDAEDDLHMVMVDGEPRIGVQLAPNHIAPDWPDGAPEQQIHLDLWVDDFRAAHDRVMSLGAKVLSPPRTSSTTTSRYTRILRDTLSVYVGFTEARSTSAAQATFANPRALEVDALVAATSAGYV